jgi:hypothetical protein
VKQQHHLQRWARSCFSWPATVKASLEGEFGVRAEGEDDAKVAVGDVVADGDADVKAKEDEIKAKDDEAKKAKRVKRKEEKDAAKKQEASESVVKESLIASAINKHAGAINNLASAVTNLADICDPLQNVLGQLPGNIAKDVAPDKAVKDVVSGVGGSSSGASGSGRKLTPTQHYTPDEVVEPATKKQRGRPRGSTVNPK